MSPDIDDRLHHAMRERVASLTIDTPAADTIVALAATQRRRRRAIAMVTLVAVLVIGVGALVARDGRPQRLAAAEGPQGGATPSTSAGALPAIPQVALDGWKTTYFIAIGDGPYVEYQFRSDAPRLDLQVSFYKQSEFDARVQDKALAHVEVRGTTGTMLDYGSGRYRVDWVERGRTWEADGAPFASRDDFLATVAEVRDVDTAAWHASLPAGTVLPDQRSRAIDDVLAGVPVPNDFDLDALRRETMPASRYDLAFEVVGRVMCAWIDEWAAGEGAQPASAAVGALGGAHQWPILRELEGAGGMSKVFWDTADRVAHGDRTVLDGYRSALGCPS